MVLEKSCDLENKFYTFYDPLYEIRIYNILYSGRPLSRLAGDMDQILGKIFCQTIDSYEFNRLGFIKQTGLSWLVFPSATHTLFSHSLGNLVLGEYALRNIFIKKNGTIIGNLEDWLIKLELKEEFLLALLLSDIGKLPFSHLLRKNEHFSKYNHKKLAEQIIRGEGDAYEFYKDKQDRALHDIFDEVEGIDIDILCYLIHHENSKKFDNQEDIEILYDIVSGKLNLDRLDHYQRDSYFIGTKFATFNIRSLLRHIYIDDESHRLCLDNEGIKYAHQLLTNKEMLLCDAFENNVVLSYDAMMDFCISKYFESIEEAERKEFPYLTDERILWSMLQKDSVSKMISRIVNRKPYLSKQIKLKKDVEIEKLKYFRTEFINKSMCNEEDILLYPLIHLDDVKNQWLNLECENGKGLFDQESYPELIGYINRKRVEREKKIYFFVSNSSIMDSLENEMKNNVEFFEHY